MREFPDLLGMDLLDAEALLAQQGQKALVQRTKPDRNGPEEGCDKVIKQELAAGQWILTVCRVPDAYR